MFFFFGTVLPLHQENGPLGLSWRIWETFSKDFLLGRGSAKSRRVWSSSHAAQHVGRGWFKVIFRVEIHQYQPLKYQMMTIGGVPLLIPPNINKPGFSMVYESRVDIRHGSIEDFLMLPWTGEPAGTERRAGASAFDGPMIPTWSEDGEENHWYPLANWTHSYGKSPFLSWVYHRIIYFYGHFH